MGMAKAMKAMKAMSAMKAMKAMKKKAVSKIAKSKNAKAVVFHGTKEKTASGLTKSDLIKNKNGKIVSKKKLAAGKKSYANIKGWTAAVQKARKALGVKGFVAIKKGSALYNKAKNSTSEHQNRNMLRLQLRVWGCPRPLSAVASSSTCHY